MPSKETQGAAGGNPVATSQLANRIWAGLGARPKDHGAAVVDKAKVTWRVGDGPNVSAATGYAFAVAMVACIVGFLFIPDNLEWAKVHMEWLEGWKVGGRISFLDWCGSCMVCFGYRRAAEKALLEGEKHARETHHSLLSHHASTLITCTFLQFGGTSLTGIFLGQVWSWSCGNHVVLAFLLAWWLTFSCPFDAWYRLMNTPFVNMPVKTFAAISAAHAVTSWGLEKAVTSEHPRMHNSVFGALVCGYLSGSMGWMVVAYFESGGALIRSSAPTWAMQRTFYMVPLYYLLTDPHGLMAETRKGAAMWVTDATGVTVPWEAFSKSAGKVVIASCHLVFMYTLDICGLDLLPLLNNFLSKVTILIAPSNMDLPFHYKPVPEKSTTPEKLTAAVKLTTEPVKSWDASPPPPLEKVKSDKATPGKATPGKGKKTK